MCLVQWDGFFALRKSNSEIQPKDILFVHSALGAAITVKLSTLCLLPFLQAHCSCSQVSSGRALSELWGQYFHLIYSVGLIGFASCSYVFNPICRSHRQFLKDVIVIGMENCPSDPFATAHLMTFSFYDRNTKLRAQQSSSGHPHAWPGSRSETHALKFCAKLCAMPVSS